MNSSHQEYYNHEQNNLNPKIWGPKFWFVIDTIIFSLPDNLNKQQEENLKAFLISLKILLPCDKCRKHYKKYMYDTNFSELDFSQKINSQIWVNKLRNNIKNHQGKINFEVDKTENLYNDLYKETRYLDIFIIVGFIAIIFFLIKKSYKIN